MPPKPKGSPLEALYAKAKSVGIDMAPALAEFEERILAKIGPQQPVDSEAIVKRAAEVVLAQVGEVLEKSMAQIKDGVQGFDQEKIILGVAGLLQPKLNEQIKTGFETFTRPIIEKQVQAALPGVVEQVARQFQGDPGRGGAQGGAATEGAPRPTFGLNIGDLLAHSPQIIEIINAFRSPTTDQAIGQQMGFIMKWHGLLSKIEKGGGRPDDLTSAIGETFAKSEP